MRAKVYFSNETELNLTEYEPVLQDVIDESLISRASAGSNPEVSVSFVNEKLIRGLNKQYRHMDSATDVLSFPMYGSWREWPAEGQTAAIGDIVISVETAMSQAEAYGHGLARELGFLTAHSMLHLMGYDHLTPEDEEEMFSLQEEILTKAGLPR